MKTEIHLTMMIKFHISLLGILSLGLSLAFSQNDPLAGKDTLILENDRVKEALEADKPYLKPPYQEIKKASTEDFNYESRDFKVETTFDPPPPTVRPAIPDKPLPTKNNLVRAGLGRYVTPFVELYLNNGQSERVNYGLDFKHISAHADKEIPLREFRQDYGNVYYGFADQVNTFKANLYIYNTSYYFFADSALQGEDEKRRKDSLKGNYTRVEAMASVQSNYDPQALFEYKGDLKLRSFANRWGNTEGQGLLYLDFGYYFTDDARIGAESDLQYINATVNDVKQNRFFFSITPDIRYKINRLKLRGGIRFYYYNNSADTTSETFIGPIVEAEYAVIENQLTVFAGATSEMRNNHLYDMTQQNPYLARDVTIKPTVERINVFAGIKGRIGRQFDYTVRAFYKRISNALVYASPENGAYFQAMYDSLTTIGGIHIELNTQLLPTLEAGAAMSYNNYQTFVLPRYFHGTPFRMDLYGAWEVLDKLVVRLDLITYSPTPLSVDAMGGIIQRGWFVNLGLKADYRITDEFSVFAEFNNLLNSKFQRWYNYQERRIDYRAGVSYAF